MQQELIEMLEEIIQYVEVWHPEDGEALDRAEALIKKAKNNAPAQEFNNSVADAEIKALYIETQGTDKGWLDIEGSYFISGVVAARRQKKATKPAQEEGLTARQFDLICQAIDKADTITMEGDYMLDSDDCISVVRVMQVLFDIKSFAQRKISCEQT